MTEKTESAFKFPCDFPIKVMGHAADDFNALVRSIVERHAGTVLEERITVRRSSNGKYLAVTVTVEALSQQQLDALYIELSGHERVVMVL